MLLLYSVYVIIGTPGFVPVLKASFTYLTIDFIVKLKMRALFDKAFSSIYFRFHTSPTKFDFANFPIVSDCRARFFYLTLTKAI